MSRKTWWAVRYRIPGVGQGWKWVRKESLCESCDAFSLGGIALWRTRKDARLEVKHGGEDGFPSMAVEWEGRVRHA